ncbi:MAG: diguanylate cyclase, partial [Sulfurimonas sp.]|nr:diguanylate cyclase [Sulfurimonas sp.]
ISIGVSSLSEGVNDLELLYHNADINLYKAKESGRNRVC